MSYDDELDQLGRALAEYPAPSGAEPSSTPPVPQSLLARLFRRLGPYVAGLALATPLFLVMILLPAPLPVYEITSVGVPFASAATPGSTVEISVSPRTAVKGEIMVQSFLACPGTGFHPWQPPPSAEITKNGFVSLRGSMENVREPGSCQIWVVIARPGSAPRDFYAQLLAGRAGPYQMLARKGHSNWEAVSATVEVRPR